MAEILAVKGFGITKTLTIYDTNDAVIVPETDDVVRVRVLRLLTIVLEVSSSAATANGSSISKNDPSSGVHTLRLDASDLQLDPGIYSMYVDFFDSSDSNEWKNVGRHQLCVEAR